MKKIMLSLMCMLVFYCPSVFANAAILIENISPKEVANQIIVGMATVYGEYVLQSQSENLLKFTKRNDVMFVGSQDDNLTYTITQQGKDTIVTLSETVQLYRENGSLYTTQNPKNDIVLNGVLESFKSVFNGRYMFGFIILEKSNGGYLIQNVVPNSPFDKAGIKNGDILISINGKPTKKVPKKQVAFYPFFDKFSAEPSTFVILSNGKTKTVVVKPEYVEPTYKKDK